MRLLDVMTSPWAIVPEKLKEIRDVYETHMKGDKIDLKAIQIARKDDPDTIRGYSVSNGVAVIPVTDVLTKNRTFFSYLFGGTSMRDIGQAFDNALEDAEVHSIVLAIDSPGGTVDGTEELAGKIMAARGGKPIVAYSDGMMASAAYWIGAAADKIYISGETTVVGSIGVVATHVDVSEADRQYGEKWTELTAGRYKRIASMHRPLSEEGRAYIQDQLDHIYTVFVEAVAGQRGRSVEQVLEGADGKIFIGKKALDIGLVDEIATLGGLISILNTKQEERNMDITELKQKHPDKAQVLIDEGRSAGIEEGKAIGKTDGIEEGRKLGSEAERERILGLMDISKPGYEELVKAAILDGKSVAGDLAIAIVKADKERESAMAKTLTETAIAPVPPSEPPAASSETFEAAVDRVIKTDGLSRGKAMARVAQDYPDLHREYIDRVNKR